MQTDIEGLRLPDGVTRAIIADTIERLIELLDDLEPDPDIEADYVIPLDGRGALIGRSSDDEPDDGDEASLGWGLHMSQGLALMRSLDDLGDDRELDTADYEPSLASPEAVQPHPRLPAWIYPEGRYRRREGSQTAWAKGGRQDLEHDDCDDEDSNDAEDDRADLEPSLGAPEEHPRPGNATGALDRFGRFYRFERGDQSRWSCGAAGDYELDEAENGIGDADGLAEQMEGAALAHLHAPHQGKERLAARDALDRALDLMVEAGREPVASGARGRRFYAMGREGAAKWVRP